MAKSPSTLLGIIAASDYRKNTLFLLLESPKTLSEIKDHFNVKSPEIIPRLKELEKARLILKQENHYELTSFGKVIATKYKPLLDTIQAMETNDDFWAGHDTSQIPEALLDQIGALKDCKVVQLEKDLIGASHEAFLKNVKKATTFKGVTSIFNPLWTKMLTELSKTGAIIEIVTTESVLNIIKNKCASELEDLLQNPNAHLYVSDAELKIAFATMVSPNSRLLSLGLHFNNGKYDPSDDLEGNDPDAVSWGNTLFEYCKEQAVAVPRLQPVNSLVFSKAESEEMVLNFE